MAKPKSIFTGPWYPWYVNDVLNSQRVKRLTLAEEGAYRRALDNAWIEGSMPSDPVMFARVIGNGCTTKIAKKIIETCFILMPGDSSKVVNQKLEKIRDEQKRKFALKSATGKKNIAKRWKQTTSGDSNGIATVYQQNSIQNQNKKKNKKEDLNPLTPLNLNGQREGILEPKNQAVKILKPDGEISIWMNAVANAVGARDLRSLTKQKRWTDVCLICVRDDLSLSGMLEVIREELNRVGDQTQFFTPEACLQKLQLRGGKRTRTETLPTLDQKRADDDAARSQLRKPPVMAGAKA